MAEAKKPEAEADAAAPKKSKKMLFIIIGVLVLVLGGGGAAFFMMKKKAAAEAEAADGEEGADAAHGKDKKTAKKKDKKDGHAAAPAFYKFDKPFTVKLVAEQQDAYLQVDLQMRVLDAAVQESLKQYDPELKHKITLLLLGKKSTDLNTAQGVQRLSNEIRDLANNTLEPPAPKKGKAKAETTEPEEHADPDAPVQAVLFTTFIVQ
jgi:flagellar FliL protein